MSKQFIEKALFNRLQKKVISVPRYLPEDAFASNQASVTEIETLPPSNHDSLEPALELTVRESISSFFDKSKFKSPRKLSSQSAVEFTTPFDKRVFEFKIDRDSSNDLSVFNTSGVTPYDVYNLNYDGLRVGGGRERINSGWDKRLSVTGLLVNKWCELNTMYKIYSRFEKILTPQMMRGSVKHGQLESLAHPIDVDLVRRFMEMMPEELSKEEKYSESVVDSIVKLVNLMINGEARELKFHHFIDRKTNVFVTGGSDLKDENMLGNRYILVSAIVDHLSIRDMNPIHRLRFKDYPFSGTFDDLRNDFLGFSEDIGPKLTISDVKTRSIPSIPAQANVVNSSKLQVSLYRKMLGLLSSSPNTYEVLIQTAKRHGVDVDAALSPLLALRFSEQLPFFESDFKELMEGIFPINYPYPLRNQSPSSELEENVVSSAERNFANYVYLLNKWKQPLTLRYFLHRYSTLLNALSSQLNNSDELELDYYHSDFGSFAQIKFQYDGPTSDMELESNVKFWLGQRPAKPIDPTYKNFSTYCTSCEYKKICIWKSYHEKLPFKTDFH
ncbi:Exo5 protein [Saccharomycopsis crataegensis]|uniref:Exonuclease V, mitochondrial n=1 Tax=Saccharomycopsis crataegensis TaxID=43959 RepID=A0AAV5QQZ0_9ASCO|nr:Exo5 protein [Saccharomycopsis crataegensis]